MNAKIGILLAGSAAPLALADVTVLPPTPQNTINYVPFGCGLPAAPLNSSTMHQVFGSIPFINLGGGAPITITDIGFAAGVSGVYNSSVTIRLGYTNNFSLGIPVAGGGGAPNASGPMTTYYSNPVYSVTIPAPSTADFSRVHFPGSFVYDPTLGNLLLEIVNDAMLGSTVDLAVSYAPSAYTSRAYTTTRFPALSDPGISARTQFTYTLNPLLMGACCYSGINCVPQTQTQCTATGGVYQGHGSTCAGACPAGPSVIHTSCNLATGYTTLSGVLAPAASLWSEAARDDVDINLANTVAGFTATVGFRIADDFTVPAGGANVAFVHVFAYTNGLTAPSVTAATLRIWNGPPNAGGTVIFGDTSTNRLAVNTFSNIYRVFNTVAGPTCSTNGTPPTIGRRLQNVYIAVNQFLPPGTYWIDFDFTGASFSPPTTQPRALGRQCDPADSNGLQWNAGEWIPLVDNGQGCSAPVAVNQGIYFQVLGTPGSPSCYPNCDLSTSQPCLDIQDFACFLNSFTTGGVYANCDASTTLPVLNVQDFGCFLNRFAAGCSGC